MPTSRRLPRAESATGASMSDEPLRFAILGARGGRERPEPVRVLCELADQGALDYTLRTFADPKASSADRTLAMMADLCRLGEAASWKWVQGTTASGPLAWIEWGEWALLPFCGDERPADVLCWRVSDFHERMALAATSRRDWCSRGDARP